MCVFLLHLEITTCFIKILSIGVLKILKQIELSFLHGKLDLIKLQSFVTKAVWLSHFFSFLILWLEVFHKALMNSLGSKIILLAITLLNIN